MLKRFLLPSLICLLGLGMTIMAATGMLDISDEPTFVQGEMDGTRVDVSAKFSARVLRTVGRDGMPVRQGGLLLELDGPEMLAKVRQAEEALKNARAQWEKVRNGVREEEMRRLKSDHAEAEAALKLAQQTFGRLNSLQRIGAASKQQFDEARNGFKQALARERKSRAAVDEAVTGARDEDLASAKANVQVLEAKLAEVRSMAADMSLHSPVTGEISKILVQEGELINAGYPLVTLVDLSDLWAVVLLRENQLAHVRMGQLFTARIPALGDRKVTFKVDYIAPLGNFATWRATNHSGSYDLKTFEVRGHPLAPVEGLRPGMSVIFPLPLLPAETELDA